MVIKKFKKKYLYTEESKNNKIYQMKQLSCHTILI